MAGDSMLSQEPELLVERLKRFTDTDLNALCEATDAAIIDGGGFGWVTPPGRRALESYFRGLLLVPERELFVARLNGDIVGSAILVRPSKNNEAQAFAASLMHSYIAPYARGHGLARRLTEAVEDRARELGYHIINLDVRETQTVAIRMYESSGYIRWGEHPDYALVRGRSSVGYFFYKRLRPPKPSGGQ
jgi:ribosomal protein S18 acetylase RimI-like enzyme